MTPLKIVREACKKRLSAIAVTDHNSAENASAVMEAARGTGLVVLPGIEVTTSEEVHILGLFEELGAALSMQELVYERLMPGENDEELFGIQVVANSRDEVESISRRLLIGATLLSVGETADAIHRRGGLVVAAHIDRGSYSILSQLGFIPDGLELDALEISRHTPLAEAWRRWPEYRRLPFITSSDAHDLEEVGLNPAGLRVGSTGMAELKKALAQRLERGGYI
jgi:PHP family Zn ribbon phosphoesterase